MLSIQSGNIVEIVSKQWLFLCTFHRMVAKGASSIRSALFDAWQLAFSVQVNPLAAVQQLPSGSLGSR